MEIMKIVFVGNFSVDFSSETHHVKTLQSLGHEVLCLQEGKITGDEILRHSLESDLLIVVHTHGWVTPGLPLVEVLKQLKGKVTTLTYHLDLWLGLERQKDLENDGFYKTIDYFFCTDKLMADWFNENTQVKGHFIPAGVFHEECIMLEPKKVDYDVIFVGSKNYHKEWGYRPWLIDWLRSTYGSRFLHVGGDGDTGVVRGLALNQIYANAKVAVGDTLCIGFNYPWYFSDRLVAETTGRGGFLIAPKIKGYTNYFKKDKEVVLYNYGNFNELKTKINYYLEHDEEREKIRLAGFERSKKDHTYIKRWQTILETIKVNS